MMDEVPNLEGRSHGGGPALPQAGRHPLNTRVTCLGKIIRTTENEPFKAKASKNKSCHTPHKLNKDLVYSMSFRPVFYWLTCSAFAVMAVGATEPGLVEADAFRFSGDFSSVQPVPEPSRALLLFAGIMAMAFTYRRAWLSWKRGV
jgi:hypothetical protein